MRNAIFCGIILLTTGSALAAESEDQPTKWVLDHKHPNGACMAEAPQSVGPVTVRLGDDPDNHLSLTIAKSAWAERSGTVPVGLKLADLPVITLDGAAHDRGYTMTIPPGVRPALLAADTVTVSVEEGQFALTVTGLDKVARSLKACVTRQAHKKPGVEDGAAKPAKSGKPTL